MNQPCQNLPSKFLERLDQIFLQETVDQILKAFETSPLPSFRTNTLKTTSVELQKRLENQGFQLKSINWYKNAFTLENKSVRELTETDEYKEGLFYIQSLSSMIPALALDPQSGDRVLDLAAAPGSKTTQLAAMMDNKGEIIANDISKPRLFKLINNLKEQGVTNTATTLIPGQSIWQKYPEYFDKTLVDVPCSMEGRFNCNDKKSYEHWSPKKVRELAIRSQYLLRSAISATKVGGTIVYSTCTLSPEENEGVIDWILKKEGDAVEVCPIQISQITLQPGLDHWHKPYTDKVKQTARIYPSGEMEGFFIAKLKKVRSTVP